MILDRPGHRLDIGRIVMERRHRPDRRLPAHAAHGVGHPVDHGRRGRGAVLRVEREHQNPLAAGVLQLDHLFGDRRQAVAHRPSPTSTRSRAGSTACCRRLRLAAGVAAQRRFVAVLEPDLGIRLRRLFRTGVEDDAPQDRLPDQRRQLDHPAVGEEFLQIAADRLRIGRLRRAQVDQEDADLAGGDRRMVLRQTDRGTGIRHRTLPDGRLAAATTPST